LAVKARRRSAFGADEWKSVPWLETQKNLKDHLLDILVNMPALLEDLDNMTACDDLTKKEALRRDLVARCWVYDRQLRAWLNSTCPSAENCAQTYQQTRIDTASLEDIGLTYAFQTFWKTCLLLYTTLRLASDLQTTLPDYTDPQIYVRNIALTTPTLLNPSAGIYGQHIMILPFALALQYSESANGQRDTLVRVMEGQQGDLVKGFLLRVNMLRDMHS
jgi:hypothetical protein